MLRITEKAIKEAASGHKFKCGHKQVLQFIKGSKLIIVSRSINHSTRLELERQASVAGIPIHEFDGNSIKLGKLCGKQFRVAVVSFKTE